MLLVLLTACDRPADDEARASEYLAALDAGQRIQLLIVEPADLSTAGAAAGVAADLPAAGAARGLGAIWVQKGTPDGLAALGSLFAGSDARPILLADLDGGIGSVAGAGTVLPPPGRLVTAGLPREDLERVGELLGREAATLGITYGFLSGPKLSSEPDTLFVARDSSRLGQRVAALSGGAGEAGLTLGISLFSEGDPLAAPPPLSWDRGRVQAIEIEMLRAAGSGSAGAVMLGGLALPSLGGGDTPAALAPEIARGMIRRDLGWEGLIVADLRLLAGPAATPRAAVDALLAGADLVLTSLERTTVVTGVRAAVESGVLPMTRIDESARRVILASIRSSARIPVSADSAATTLAQIATEEGRDISRQAFDHLEQVRRAAAASAIASPAWTDFNESRASSAGMNAVRLQAVDRAIQLAIRDSVFGSAALAVSRGGNLVRFRGYGTIAPGGGPVDPLSTLFDIASLTKVVGTTTAAAILVDDGRLDLDAPVSLYLEELESDGREDVTIRHLLSHTSGLPSGSWLFGSADTPREALEQALGQSLTQPAGEGVEYSDLGLIILAEVIGRIAGVPLDAFLATRLLVPLGMSSTMFLPALAFLPRVVPTTSRETERPYPVRGVVHDANAFRLAGIAGHAGIFSTLRDLAVFSQMMLRGGSYGPARVLSEETVRTFTSRQAGAEERALGWDTPAATSSAGRFASPATFGHTGYTGTSIWIDPSYDLFVVLLTNRTWTEASAAEILRLRRTVHEAVYQSITDQPVRRRVGAR